MVLMNLEPELRIIILRKEILLHTSTTTSTVDDMTNMTSGRARLLTRWETRYGSESRVEPLITRLWAIWKAAWEGCEMPDGRARLWVG